MNNNDDEVFLKHLGKITPIKKKNRIHKEVIKVPKGLISKKKETVKELVKTKTENKNLKNTKYSIEVGGVNKLLRRGKVVIDKKIDFHGRTINEAKEIFNQAIVNSYNQNKRCILFITGKGLRYNKNENNQDYKNQPKLFYGKIRESFLDWVKDPKLSKYILTFEKAGIEKGGDGAFYIYLRKKKFSL